MHDNGRPGFFPFRCPAPDVKPVRDLGAIPDLLNLQGKEFADPQAGSNAQNDKGAVSEGVSTFKVFQGEAQFFCGEGRATYHSFF
jgi:hypothetical protein